MMTYATALDWCIRHHAVFRFVRRRERGEFLAANMDIPGDLALELAVDVLGQTQVGHYPLDSSKEPSKAIALAIISCVEWFEKQIGKGLVTKGGVN